MEHGIGDDAYRQSSVLEVNSSPIDGKGVWMDPPNQSGYSVLQNELAESALSQMQMDDEYWAALNGGEEGSEEEDDKDGEEEQLLISFVFPSTNRRVL